MIGNLVGVGGGRVGDHGKRKSLTEFFYLFIFGCTGFSLLHAGSL